MTDKNDFMKVAPPGMLTVTSRQDSSQNQYDQKKKKKDAKKQTDDAHEEELEEFEIDELVEFGMTTFKKRNTEKKLFLKMKDQNNLTQASSLCHEKPTESEDSETVDDDPQSTENLSKLHVAYKSYLKIVKEESKIINIDDIDHFDDIIHQKDVILDHIDIIIKSIDFDIFKKDLIPASQASWIEQKFFFKKNEKNIKADEILSDIHKVINEIVRLEDENSVELQNLKERMKLDMAKQERGAKAISQYGQPNTRSHFIDKKT